MDSPQDAISHIIEIATRELLTLQEAKQSAKDREEIKRNTDNYVGVAVNMGMQSGMSHGEDALKHVLRIALEYSEIFSTKQDESEKAPF